MGLLDDAIREHLELKRRRGADDAEVQRQEEEALGAHAREAEPESAAAPEPAPEPEPEPVAEEPPAPEAQPAPPPPAAATAPVFTPAPKEDPEDWYDEPDEVPFEDSLERRRPQETSEFTAEEAREAGAGAESEYVAPDEEAGEDLLEETPDFLQETPEHDRLWFEQKPPRDFDFGS